MFAVAVGAAVPISGFQPVNHLPDVIGVLDDPRRVILTPTCLAALLALLAAIVFPARETRRMPRGYVIGAVLLVLGTVISLFGSSDPTSSAVIGVMAVSAPCALVLALHRADLSPTLVAGSFLATTTALLLRADVVFARQWGVPTPGDLFAAKYRNVPYDFHYYTLGNPDHTAGWLLMVLAMALFWALGRELGRGRRVALGVCVLVTMATLLLTYARLAAATGIVLLIVAAVVAPVPRRARIASILGVLVFVAAVIVTNRGYLSTLLSTASNASAVERAGSTGEGLAALADHPLTGVGLGQFSAATGQVTAHSTVIQAAAEMGLLGLWALTLLSGAAVAHAVTVVRRTGWLGLRAGAAIGLATYALHGVMAAPADEGLYSGLVSVWGLTAALLLSLSLEPPPRGGSPATVHSP